MVPYQRPFCNETENRTNVAASDLVGNPQKKNQMLSSDPEAAAKNPDWLPGVT